MTRRPVLPGADELFRRTDNPPAAEVTELTPLSSAVASPALRSARRSAVPEPEPEQPASLTLVPGGAPADPLAAFRAPAPPPVPAPGARTRGKAARASGAGRTRHDEKITVYISAEDLLALESARLSLRAQHGVAADRGRIVREAVSVLLADLAENGEDSVLVRRLKG
ncbi:hypothetical protein SAMN04488107_2278 [Geodermatophilus saharensis]|uniref:Cobyrinic acid a,c-diamide synthase n=1 Tax=Geodermatophilus saharensis TaxID=1137994 RepID=A0A239DMX9_9ACTN|nr:hypothetical protein [Geodermatophilus saharensis]SNS33975.1 hypothetical protein SAMN04488107_2278 [Geodermatophilus saharensis]